METEENKEVMPGGTNESAGSSSSQMTPAKGKKSKKGTALTAAAVACFVGGSGLIGWSIYEQQNPEQVNPPAASAPFEAGADAPEVSGPASIEGANTGAGSDSEELTVDTDGDGVPDAPAGSEGNAEGSEGGLGFDLADGFELAGTDEERGVPQVTGPDRDIPAVGNFDDGERGVLTEDTPNETRGTRGDPISRELEQSCPGIVNGSICIPSTNDVIVYHDVGTRHSTVSNDLVMNVPSTRSAGLLNTTSPIGADQGTSVIAAHVLFQGGLPGPFWNVPTLEAGDEIIVRDMNGKNFTYKVHKKTVHEWDQLPKELFDTTTEPQIALVTCTGTYTDGTFDKRAIAWATPVN